MKIELVRSRRMTAAEIAAMRARAPGGLLMTRRTLIAGAGLVSLGGVLRPVPAEANAVRAVYMFASAISFAADAFQVWDGVRAWVDLWNSGEEAERQTMMGVLRDSDGAIEDQNGYNVLVDPGYTQTFNIQAGPQRPGEKSMTCNTEADETTGYCRIIE